MPLRGPAHSKLVRDQDPYFVSLADLDVWAATPRTKLNGLLQHTPTRCFRDKRSDGRGQLLVCHDYKGGYTEHPSGLSYTFNFWWTCDTFVYFSHHRVSVPPSGWVTAAHRQGVKILGTLIFESGAEEDCLRLLVGHLPKSKTGPATPSAKTTTLPLSPHYARVLAQLAHHRGFDGYLLNFECPLQGGIEQTRALSAWIKLLQSELEAQIGPHAQSIWYDSVIIDGRLRWQDRLNSLNLPFFLASTGFFTNYTWWRDGPSSTAQYFLSLDPSLTRTPSKSLRHIYTGVDVWGRGSHGGGGLGCYKAISHIDPEFLGLSVALFGQAWTWESEQDNEGWNWTKWWEYERTLWVGPKDADKVIDVPEAPRREGEPECVHGPFLPISTFFPRRPPPNPADLPFFSSFCPGVGMAWFVNGTKVLQTEKGWTDVGKQTSLGDMVWPRPPISWEDDERSESLPRAYSTLCMDDAWIGGSCLQLSLSGQGSKEEEAFFRCVWLPVQSFTITPRLTYEANAICKFDTFVSLNVDFGLSVKSLDAAEPLSVEITPSSISHTDLPGGWTKLSIQFCLPTDQQADLPVAIGLVIGFAAEDPTEAYELSVFLGQLTVFPSVDMGESASRPTILWADFERTLDTATKLPGVLTWEISTSFPQLGIVDVKSPEDPIPAWPPVPHPEQWMPSFMYSNIYVQSLGGVLNPDKAVFIGTTGWDGYANRFYVDPECLPEGVDGERGLRFYVQGVTNRGEILSWPCCAFVDVE